jgi:transposase-like protein
MIVSGTILLEIAVTDEDFDKLLAAIGALSELQLTALDAAIRGRLGSATAQAAAAAEIPEDPGKPAGDCTSIAEIETRFAAALRCPHCQSTAIAKWGSANRLKRYRCKSCKTTFNALTGTPLAQLHKRELWIGHAQALVDGISLRKVASRLDVHLTTAFRWRHRFLKAPKGLKPKVLAGTVEADETYFLHSGLAQAKTPGAQAWRQGGKTRLIE